jgi:hypothetical protein
MIIYSTHGSCYTGDTHISYNRTEGFHFEPNLQQQVTAGRSAASHARQSKAQSSLFAWRRMEISRSITEQCKQGRVLTQSLTSHAFTLLLFRNLYFLKINFVYSLKWQGRLALSSNTIYLVIKQSKGSPITS